MTTFCDNKAVGTTPRTELDAHLLDHPAQAVLKPIITCDLRYRHSRFSDLCSGDVQELGCHELVAVVIAQRQRKVAIEVPRALITPVIRFAYFVEYGFEVVGLILICLRKVSHSKR